MKVYIICHQAEIWEESSLDGVFKDKERAKKMVKELEEEYPYDRIMIEEWEVTE